MVQAPTFLGNNFRAESQPAFWGAKCTPTFLFTHSISRGMVRFDLEAFAAMLMVRRGDHSLNVVRGGGRGFHEVRM